MIETRPHPTIDGILVRSDGMIFIPENKSNKAHWTYGTIGLKGYYQICVRHKKYRVHRLVAETFIPNPETKSIVDHIDRNPLNNNVDNLRWVTPSENCLNKKNNCPVGHRKCDFENVKDYNSDRSKRYREKRAEELPQLFLNVISL